MQHHNLWQFLEAALEGVRSTACRESLDERSGVLMGAAIAVLPAA